MIFNLSAGDNTSEEVAILLTEFMNEVNNTLTSFKSEVNTMLSGFTDNVDSDVTVLSNNLNTVKNDIAIVKSSIDTMNTTVSNLGGAVKSVQRGIAKGVDSEKADNVNITINKVNPSKCMVLLNNKIIESTTNTVNTTAPALISITETMLTISASSYYGSGGWKSSEFSWQVIEFY